MHLKHRPNEQKPGDPAKPLENLPDQRFIFLLALLIAPIIGAYVLYFGLNDKMGEQQIQITELQEKLENATNDQLTFNQQVDSWAGTVEARLGARP